MGWVRDIAMDRLRQARLAPFDRRGDEALVGIEDDRPDALAAVEARQRLASWPGPPTVRSSTSSIC